MILQLLSDPKQHTLLKLGLLGESKLTNQCTSGRRIDEEGKHAHATNMEQYDLLHVWINLVVTGDYEGKAEANGASETGVRAKDDLFEGLAVAELTGKRPEGKHDAGADNVQEWPVQKDVEDDGRVVKDLLLRNSLADDETRKNEDDGLCQVTDVAPNVVDAVLAFNRDAHLTLN